MYQSYWHDFLPWINTFWFNFAILSDSIIISLYSEGIKMNKLIQARITGCGDIKKKKKKKLFDFKFLQKSLENCESHSLNLGRWPMSKKWYVTPLIWAFGGRVRKLWKFIAPSSPFLLSFHLTWLTKHAYLPCMLPGTRRSQRLAINFLSSHL